MSSCESPDETVSKGYFIRALIKVLFLKSLQQVKYEKHVLPGYHSINLILKEQQSD